METLSDILHQDLLASLAGDRFFQRGVDYFERGLVDSLAQYGETIDAVVRGTHPYQVRLWLQDGDLQFRCSCPVGADGDFCKHCVAVGLAWIAEPPLYRPEEDPELAGTTMADLRNYLSQQDRETLVQLIMDKAIEDDRWQQQLLMKVALQQEDGIDINVIRQSLKNAIEIDDFIEYPEIGDYLENIRFQISYFEDLLEAGYARDVIQLTQEIAPLLEAAIDFIEDSDGEIGSIIEQVEDFHYRACQIGQPNPQELAQQLFSLELGSNYYTFHNAVIRYADFLGKEGLEKYRQLVEAEWAKIPHSEARSIEYALHYRKLVQMRENLVELTGTLEDLVKAIAQDLSHPDRYIKIAQLYQQHGHPDKAIEWAESGLHAFQKTWHMEQFEDYLMALYEQKGRFDDLMAVAWRQFCRLPFMRTYETLKQKAQKAGNWEYWQQQAIAHLQQAIAKFQNQPNTYELDIETYSSVLVKIYLQEQNTERAWQQAQKNGCNSDTWMELADKRLAEAPEDSLSVYMPQVEPLIRRTNNSGYREAIDLLVKIKEAMTRLNREKEFAEYLKKLQTTYKRKRNFIKFLKERGLISN